MRQGYPSEGRETMSIDVEVVEKKNVMKLKNYSAYKKELFNLKA